MELEGHPTQDLIEELQTRGAVRMQGSSSGPNPQALRFLIESAGESGGFWLFCPYEAFDTGFDENPRV